MFTNFLLSLVLLTGFSRTIHQSSVMEDCIEPLVIYQEYLEGTFSIQCVTESSPSILVAGKMLEQFAVAPTEKHLAYVTSSEDNSTLYLLDLENGNAEPILTGFHTIWIQWLSHNLLGIEAWDHFPRPSGTDFAQHLLIYNTEENVSHTIDTPSAKLVGLLDSQNILFANSELGLFTINFQGLTEVIPVPDAIAFRGLEFDISHDGQQIVYVDNECLSENSNSRSCFVLFNPESNEVQAIDKLSVFNDLAFPLFSPNDRYIAFMSYRTGARSVSIYDLEEHDMVIVGEEGSVIGYRWLQDTDELLITYQEVEDIGVSNITNLYLVDPISGEMVQVTDTRTIKFLR